MVNKYSYEQVLEASLKYFNGDDLAAKVFADKYALQDTDGKYDELTPDDMHKRLAKEFARIEQKYPNPMSEEEIYGLLKGFKYIVPQGSPMFGIGNNYFIQSLGNCFVINSPHDSYGGICKSDQELVQLMKRRAGVGLDLSNIRPKGMITNNAAKTTDGISVFMERFSNSCREVAQSGRRGALLQSISIEHPEVETFISIKRNLKKVTGANISVRLTDEFMNAVKNNKSFKLRWPIGSKTPKIEKTIDAKELWNKLIENAWTSAEPGIFFWDTVIKNSPADVYGEKDKSFKTQSSNPCGEITMGVDSCRLLVVNLLNFVESAFTKQSKFNFDHFAKVVIKAQRLMDDLIDLEIEKIEKIIAKIESDPEPEEIKSTELNLWKEFKRTCIAGRRTGLGITALGDTLAALNVKYGSKKSIDFADEIYKYLAVNAYKSSCIMSKERGAFPLYEYELEKNHQFISRVVSQDDELAELYKRYGRRNIALTTTAPTGSVSTLTQTSSGIEPVYLLSYVRRKKINPNDKDAKIDFVDDLGDKWQEFTVYHHGIKKWMEVTGESDITKSPYSGGTSNDVDWVASVDIQAAAQKWICHSISKTCNLPNSASKELVSDVYMRAWESGCKGFTVYRDGCRTGVLVSDETHKKQKQQDKDGRPFNMQQSFAPKRPQELFCDIKKAKIQGEQWTLLVGLLEGKPYEVFGGLSKFIDIPNKHKVGKIIKNGKVDGVSTYNLIIGDEDDAFIIKNIADVFDNPNNGSLTRSISLSLRHGIPIQFIVEQLQKDKYSDMTSFSKILARTLKSYIKDGTISSEKVCPNCKKEGALMYQEGCISCSCGYAKCG